MRKPKIRGRICANSKYVLKFDLGLGCIKYTDDKNAKAKSGFDGWDGLAIYMQMSIIETHHIYTVHSTRVAQHAPTHPRCGKEQQPSDCPKVGAVGVRTN